MIDARAEDLIFAELDKEAEAGASFVAISEERGEISFGDGGQTHVVIDPIDGSLNARRMIPSHSLSVAVASGRTMADVEFGYVYDFGAGEEFVAVRGEGATLDGDRLEVAPEGEQLELVGLEAARPEKTVAALSAMKDHVYRLRIIGSIAITGAYVGAGRLDGMLNLRNCRSVDAAACQLIVREAGGAVRSAKASWPMRGLDLDARYPIAAASSENGLRLLREFQRASRSSRRERGAPGASSTGSWPAASRGRWPATGPASARSARRRSAARRGAAPGWCGTSRAWRRGAACRRRRRSTAASGSAPTSTGCAR